MSDRGPLQGWDVAEIIRRLRAPLCVEVETQAVIETALRAGLPGVLVEREKRLDARDRPDFLVDGGIVVEVKLKGASKMGVYRQLARYAGHVRVRAIVLATNTSMGLPELIEGKPTFYVHLARAWM